jgi:hypothetical protein
MQRDVHRRPDEEAHAEVAKSHGRGHAISNGFSIRRRWRPRGQTVRRNARRREDPLATLLLTLARTDYFVVRALLEAIERDQLKILTATIHARMKLQLPYFSDGHRRKAHTS